MNRSGNIPLEVMQDLIKSVSDSRSRKDRKRPVAKCKTGIQAVSSLGVINEPLERVGHSQGVGALYLHSWKAALHFLRYFSNRSYAVSTSRLEKRAISAMVFWALRSLNSAFAGVDIDNFPGGVSHEAHTVIVDHPFAVVGVGVKQAPGPELEIVVSRMSVESRPVRARILKEPRKRECLTTGSASEFVLPFEHHGLHPGMLKVAGDNRALMSTTHDNGVVRIISHGKTSYFSSRT